MKRFTFLLTIFGVLAFASHSHLPTVSAQSPETFILQSASGALTAATTSSEVASKYSIATVYLDITTLTLADADDEVDFYIQTSYDDGSNWVDCQNFHFTDADNGSTATKIAVIDGAVDGPGTVKSIAGTDPAAGNEVSETVPANALWSVESISAALVTDGTGANRRVRATLDDGSTVFYQASAGVDHTASLTVRYSWSPLGANAAAVVAATDATAIVPLPSPTVLGPGYKFVTVTGAIVAGDNWGAPQIRVAEWHDDTVYTDGSIRDNVRAYNRPLGTHVRIKTAVTGATAPTYAFNATVMFR